MPRRCHCTSAHAPRLVAVTGGPGGGKTAVLEVVRRHFCEHVVVLPEAAGILFTGGFPRQNGEPARRAAQRAIYRVQVELERMTLEQGTAAVILCDRGTVDGAAYWTGPGSFWEEVDSTLDTELARYAAVIHLRTPPATNGYDHTNPVRVETAEQAAALDKRILDVWAGHPHRTVIASQPSFFDKLKLTIEEIHEYVPVCCHKNGR